MASPAVEGPPFGPGWLANIQLDEEARVAGELGRAMLSLGRTAGCSATVLPFPLCRFGNFMKKEGRRGTAGEEIAGGYCSPDTWRRASWGDGGGRLVGPGGVRENGMMEGGGLERERERELWLRPSWGDRARGVGPPPPSSFLSISFLRLVKNFTKRNFIFPSHPSPAFARHGTAGPPYPGSRKILISP